MKYKKRIALQLVDAALETTFIASDFDRRLTAQTRRELFDRLTHVKAEITAVIIKLREGL